MVTTWELLANAIVLQAVKDWKEYPEMRDNINQFFRSSWCGTLTDLSPDKIIYSLYAWLHREEMKYLKKRKAGK